MKKLFLLCVTALIMSAVCCKKDDTEPKAPTSPPSAWHWDGVYYCASFVNGSGDTLCKKVVTVAQMDSMDYAYGAHIYCTYPNNSGVEVVGKQINASSECH